MVAAGLEVMVAFLVFLLLFNCDQSKSTTDYKRESFWTSVVFSAMTAIELAMLIWNIIRTWKRHKHEYWEVTLSHFIVYLCISLAVGVAVVAIATSRNRV